MINNSISSSLNNCEAIKRNVSIEDFLQKLGFKPIKIRGKERGYLANMIRDSDTIPSLFVNTEKQIWYDHGSAQGGTIVDLGMAIWKLKSISETVLKFQELYAKTEFSIANQEPKKASIDQERVPYFITKIQSTGNNSILTDYLSKRGIHITRSLLEVYWSIKAKNYFGIGWKNDSGGIEVRNPYFKGCLGKKDLTTISGNEKLLIFEGMFDYHSHLYFQKESRLVSPESAIVLNSTAMLEKAIKAAAQFSSIKIFFDNDATGKEASMKIKKAIPKVEDLSYLYKGYKDYNEKLEALKKNEVVNNKMKR